MNEKKEEKIKITIRIWYDYFSGKPKQINHKRVREFH